MSKGENNIQKMINGAVEEFQQKIEEILKARGIYQLQCPRVPVQGD